jgi:uncharacterized membrane protein YbhN (UPF0104 family)
MGDRARSHSVKALPAWLQGPGARAVLKVVLAAAIVASVVTSLGTYRQALVGRLEHINLSWLLVAFAVSPVLRAVNAYGWALVVRSLGYPIQGLVAVRLWLISETMRWLPGSVWSFLSRVAQAKSAGVPAATASLSLPLELLVSIGAYVLTAVVGIGLSGTAGAWLQRLPLAAIAAFALVLVLMIATALMLSHWLPSTRIAKKVRGLEESMRALRTARPKIAPLVGAFSLSFALCFCSGATFLAVLRATTESTPGLLAVTGINAAGWLIGFFAFFAPAGMAVREGAMTAMLAPLVPLDAALVAVLLWRVIQIVAEVICLGVWLIPIEKRDAPDAARSPSAT